MKHPIISFVIPVRHHDNAVDWDLTMDNLSQTVGSLINQSNDSWECIIVANTTSILPEFDSKIKIQRVDFESNALYLRSSCNTQEIFYDAVREDKGKRVLAGLKVSSDSKYYMILDDDDFVHRKLVDCIVNDPVDYGWYIDKGYIWSDKGNFLLKVKGFDEKCGSSLIIEKKLVDYSTDNIEYIKNIYGSHKYIKDNLRNKGYNLKRFPFYAAIYRVGSGDNHSGMSGIFKNFIFNRSTILSPLLLITRILNLRYLSIKQARNFFSGTKC